MNERRLFLMGAVLLTLVAMCGCDRATDGRLEARTIVGVEAKGLEFTGDYERALQQAKEESKPILVYFTAANCVFSREMNETTLSDPKVIELANRFICVQIDVNSREGGRICDQLGIVGSPTIQFLAPSGTPLQRLPQKHAASELLFQMQAVLYSLAWHETQVR
ncbi:MAG: thioredoxin family protein [Planctomycetia bacterium]|nr:thioredoxin family protein [Planctomycetia bacterium]